MKVGKIAFIMIGFMVFSMSMFLLFEPSTDPTGFFTYVSGIAIINHDNTVGLNTNLEINFMTRGVRDLEVTSSDKIEFVELRCGDVVIAPEQTEEIIFVPSYSCKENSFLVVNVMSNKLELDFKFGSDIQQAQNTVLIQ